MDLARLGLVADSSGLLKADKALDDLAASPKQAEAQTGRYGKTAITAGKNSRQLGADVNVASKAFDYAKTAIGGIVVALGLNALKGASDAYTEFGNRLKVAGVE